MIERKRYDERLASKGGENIMNQVSTLESDCLY
jgi:hypothetical protein